ncbi:hypothetical protein Leryth_000784 [Lithospermum erythrorhizon]|nr:hypothetical protein Leryth_000784 [Lithospermum erythrorhizon]
MEEDVERDMLEERRRQAAPHQLVQQLSEEELKEVGGVLPNVSASTSNTALQGFRHRHSRSEIITSFHRRSNSLRRWKYSMQKALRWGINGRDESWSSCFNPEILADQKRKWYQLHSKNLVCKKYEEPSTLFEHFIVAGLHPNVNLESVEAAYVQRKKWEMELEKSDMVDLRMLQHRGPLLPTLEPQILFKYPPEKKLDVPLKDLSTFCFPGGVKAHVLEKTPSLSELNELIYGQEHLSRDDLAFVFSLKVSDSTSLYGICLHVHEFVQRPPAIIGVSSPIYQSSSGCNRFVVSAPRCYCVLTNVPFFELHFEMLNSIIAQDRLKRITQFVSEMTLFDYAPSSLNSSDRMSDNIDSSYDECESEWMASAIPVTNVVALTAAAAGIISDDEIRSSSSRCEPFSPASASFSETSADHSEARDFFKDGKRNSNYVNGCASEDPATHFDSSDRWHGAHENGQTSEIGSHNLPIHCTMEDTESYENMFSSARSLLSEDEDDGSIFSHEKDVGNEMIKETKNDLLQVVCRYHSMDLPSRGSEIVFQPLEHVHGFVYRRPPVSVLGVDEKHLQSFLLGPRESAKVKQQLAVAEEAVALSLWTTATICRVLSLENILALLSAVLLERQMVIICPNLGVLSAVVLSIIPIIRPFEWQSLLLPVLPAKMLDFLDAPVPFIVGVQHLPPDLKMKMDNLVQVNAVGNQIRARHLPRLPRQKQLTLELAPIFSRLSSQSSMAERHPVYKCNDVQAEAAGQFLVVLRRYMDYLCADLRSYTITNVQSNNDRVSILLKDTFVESFSSSDQPFIKLFVDTQLFTVLTDSRLSSFENEF